MLEGRATQVQCKRIIGAAEFLFVEQPGQGIEPGAADFRRHVGGVKPCGNCLFLDFLDQRRIEPAGPLDFGLVRIKLALDETARRCDDLALLFTQRKIHGRSVRGKMRRDLSQPAGKRKSRLRLAMSQLATIFTRSSACRVALLVRAMSLPQPSMNNFLGDGVSRLLEYRAKSGLFVMHRRRWLFFLILAALAVLVLQRDRLPSGPAFAWLKQIGRDATPEAAAKTETRGSGRRNGSLAIAVEVATATAGSLVIERRTIGTVVPVETTNLAIPVAGMVAEVLARDGAVVKAGDLILRFDDRIVRAAIEKDKAQLAKDQAGLDQAIAAQARVLDLVTKGVSTKQAGDDAQTAMRQAQAAIAVDQAQLSADEVALTYTEIRAPFDGRLGAMQVSKGAYLASGNWVATLTRITPVYVEFSLPESDLALARQAFRNSQLSVAVVPALANDTTQPETGKVVFIDNAVEFGLGDIPLARPIGKRRSRADGRPVAECEGQCRIRRWTCPGSAGCRPAAGLTVRSSMS